ncbi:MAG: beta-N-acetylhexosaminidase [Elusimicrobiota bacterium]
MSDPGRLFMFGVYGLKPSRQTVSLFKSTQATGVLLLARNIETPAQTKAYAAELEQRLGRPLLIAIDHEGGWVLRFKSGVTPFPGNAALGRARDPKLAYAVGRQMARELAPLGIRMNLAPVLDVATKNYNPGIGIRSFGSNPILAGRLGAAFIRGMQDNGVSACAKHFPGKGAATVDAHTDLPTIKLPRAAFSRTHLAPFRAACAAGVDAVMTSHVRYPSLDAEPGTFSKKIVRDILRGELAYDGLVVSDDLCMGAITKRRPVAEAALKCLDAGHDVLMIAHDLQGMADSVDLLREAGAPEENLAAADARITRLLHRRKAPAAELAEGAKLSSLIANRAVVVARQGETLLPIPLSPKTLVVIPDFKEVRELFTFEGGPASPEVLARRLAPGCSFARAPISTTNLGRLPELAKRAGHVVFISFEARRFPGQAAALRLLAKTAAAKTAAVLVRSSWDLDLCPRMMTVLDAAGYRLVSLEAALSRTLSRRK